MILSGVWKGSTASVTSQGHEIVNKYWVAISGANKASGSGWAITPALCIYATGIPQLNAPWPYTAYVSGWDSYVEARLVVTRKEAEPQHDSGCYVTVTYSNPDTSSSSAPADNPLSGYEIDYHSSLKSKATVVDVTGDELWLLHPQMKDGKAPVQTTKLSPIHVRTYRCTVASGSLASGSGSDDAPTYYVGRVNSAHVWICSDWQRVHRKDGLYDENITFQLDNDGWDGPVVRARMENGRFCNSPQVDVTPFAVANVFRSSGSGTNACIRPQQLREWTPSGLPYGIPII